MMARVWYTCMLTMYAGLYSTFFMKQKKSSHVAHKKNDQLAFFGLSKHEMGLSYNSSHVGMNFLHSFMPELPQPLC